MEWTIIFTLVSILFVLVVYTLRRSANVAKAGEERFRKILDVTPAAVSITDFKRWAFAGCEPGLLEINRFSSRTIHRPHDS